MRLDPETNNPFRNHYWQNSMLKFASCKVAFDNDFLQF